MRYIVWATVAFNTVMISTPKKLKTAAIHIALRTSIDRVETQVAMAFGASVQPFTKITPNVSTVVAKKTGFVNWLEKSPNEMVMHDILSVLRPSRPMQFLCSYYNMHKSFFDCSNSLVFEIRQRFFFAVKAVPSYFIAFVFLFLR
jgi:hypothetical protein